MLLFKAAYFNTINKKGVLLWSLDTAIPPYRVEFVNKEELKDYFLP